jgi:hypothetical protein
MAEPLALEYRILPNGSGWYWEIIGHDREVLARGIADTQAHARADAVIEGLVLQAPEILARKLG